MNLCLKPRSATPVSVWRAALASDYAKERDTGSILGITRGAKIEVLRRVTGRTTCLFLQSGEQ